MKGKFIIRELNTFKEMSQQLSLINQLSPDIKQADYERMLKEMLKNGYRMIIVEEGKIIIGVSGFWIGTKLYSDKYLEADNVVIDEAYRSKGIGKLLMDWLTEEAKRCNCKMIMLDAYVENFPGHRFYYREGFIARGNHFLKKI